MSGVRRATERIEREEFARGHLAPGEEPAEPRAAATIIVAWTAPDDAPYKVLLLRRPDGDPVGKRLEFLLQEISRETNTTNAKSADLELSRSALALKAEVEKVREQIQNLE
jgi:hypothetical protein